VLNYVNDTVDCSYDSSTSLDGVHYVPYESDLSIQNPGDAWFYHEGHPYLSGVQLWSHYLETVGRGSHFILNMPPNTTGVITDEFVVAAQQLGDAVEASFGTGTAVASIKGNVTNTCNSFEIVLEAPAAGSFDAVMMQEVLTEGQTVLGYDLELRNSATMDWLPLATANGRTVGTKLIDVIPSSPAAATPAVQYDAVRFRCTATLAGKSNVPFTLSTFSLHKMVPPPVVHTTKPLGSYVNTKLKDHAPCAFRSGGCVIYTSDGYTHLRDEALVVSTRDEDDQHTKWVWLVYDIAVFDNGLSDGEAQYQPADYADETSTGEKFAVYVADSPGRVELFSYYSPTDKDFWVVGSAASKAEATAKGFKLVGSLGYGLAPGGWS
jgi:hypothetical protein